MSDETAVDPGSAPDFDGTARTAVAAFEPVVEDLVELRASAVKLKAASQRFAEVGSTAQSADAPGAIDLDASLDGIERRLRTVLDTIGDPRLVVSRVDTLLTNIAAIRHELLSLASLVATLTVGTKAGDVDWQVYTAELRSLAEGLQRMRNFLAPVSKRFGDLQENTSSAVKSALELVFDLRASLCKPWTR